MIGSFAEFACTCTLTKEEQGRRLLDTSYSLKLFNDGGRDGELSAAQVSGVEQAVQDTTVAGLTASNTGEDKPQSAYERLFLWILLQRLFGLF